MLHKNYNFQFGKFKQIGNQQMESARQGNLWNKKCLFSFDIID